MDPLGASAVSVRSVQIWLGPRVPDTPFYVSYNRADRKMESILDTHITSSFDIGISRENLHETYLEP